MQNKDAEQVRRQLRLDGQLPDLERHGLADTLMALFQLRGPNVDARAQRRFDGRLGGEGLTHQLTLFGQRDVGIGLGFAEEAQRLLIGEPVARARFGAGAEAGHDDFLRKQRRLVGLLKQVAHAQQQDHGQLLDGTGADHTAAGRRSFGSPRHRLFHEKASQSSDKAMIAAQELRTLHRRGRREGDKPVLGIVGRKGKLNRYFSPPLTGIGSERSLDLRQPR